MRLLRPLIANSSAKTRSALSDTMKFTVLTRSSASAASNSARVKSAPLAPVAATVSTWAVGSNGLGIKCCKFGFKLTGIEHREAPGLSQAGFLHEEYFFNSSTPPHRGAATCAVGSEARDQRHRFAWTPEICARFQ